ncbi:hypothetical protein BKK56_06235 [Rodentibacter genomosp. 2]|uniref:hypothetical protein n=1 Tax=Rodentibacter genomosp. 2 TaxID=1908266 RepID=UPI0009879FF5|nr:hypothetical protein BKK56_06235 [Rodentibacter genomosp. 2]
MKKLIIIITALFITACANNKENTSYIIHQEDIEINNSQNIILSLNRGFDDRKEIGEKFRVVRPSHTAQATTLKILSIIPAAFSGSSVTAFTKFDLVGDMTKMENIYKNYLFEKLKNDIKSNVKLDKETKNQIVKITPNNFVLIYDELVGNNNYTLYLDFTLSFTYKNKSEDGNIIAGDKELKCNEKTEGKDLKEWEKNEYQEVLTSAKKLIDKCIIEFKPMLSELK